MLNGKRRRESRSLPVTFCWKSYVSVEKCGRHYLTIFFQETDKATIDVEAPEDGILAKIIVCGIFLDSSSPV